MRHRSIAVVLLALMAACGEDHASPVDAAPPDARALAPDALSIDAPPPPGDTCAAAVDLTGATFPHAATTVAAANDTAASCSQWAGVAPEVFFVYDAGIAPIDLIVDVERVTTGFDPVVSTRAACDDPASEVLCVQGDGNEHAELLEVSGLVHLIVDGARDFGGEDQGAFTISIATRAIVALGDACDPDGVAARCATGMICDAGTCATIDAATACADAIDLTADLAGGGSTASGTVFSFDPDFFRGGCAFDASPLYAERIYRFDVFSPSAFSASTDDPATTFDTVLYLRAAGCDGDEIACDDDVDSVGGEYRSELRVDLLVPGTYYLFVDRSSGYVYGDPGGPLDYALNMTLTAVVSPGDAGPPDAALPPPDAALPDAPPPPPDAGPADAPPPAPDAAPPDAPGPCAADPACPVLHWRLDDTGATATDTSGAGNDGTLAGGAWTAGLADGGLALDGVDDYVDTAYPATAGAGPAEWTIEAWIHDAKGSGTLRHIVELHPAAWYGLEIDTANRLAVPPCAASTVTVPSRQWAHVAAVYAAGTITYYVNGVPAGESTCAFAAWYWQDVRVGAASAADSGRFAGTLDEVRIYDAPRMAAEIADDASVLSLHLDEGTGGVAGDTSGLGNDAVLAGATWVPGASGSALAFAPGAAVSVPPGGELDLIDAFTIEARVQRAAAGAGTDVLLAKADGVTAGGWRLVVDEYDRAAFAVDGVGAIIAGVTTLSDGTWRAVKVTRKGEAYEIYIDGVLDATTVSMAGPTANPLPVTLGAAADGSGAFQGSIDDARVAPYAQPAPAPIARYRSDEGSGTTSADTSGNHHDATLLGATWAPGVSGSAVSFDGVDDYVNTAFPAAAGGVSTWTMEAWVYDTKGAGTLRHVMIVWPTAWYGLQIDTANRLQVAPCAPSAGTARSRQWTHLAATYDGTTVRYYVNGVEVGSAACAFPPTYFAGLRLGAASAADSGRFKGAIDEARLYAGARSAAEISDDASMLALHLNEGIGITTVDASGALGNGAIAGATWTVGASGFALSFDGLDDVVDVPDLDTLDLTGAFTIEAKVQRGPSAGATQVIAAKGDASTPAGWRLVLDASARAAFLIDGVGAVVTGATPLAEGVWTEIRVTRKGEIFTLRLDGVVDGVALSPASPAPNALPVTLGATADGGAPYLGALDELRIAPYAQPEHDLEARYRLDEGVGTTSLDTSGNGHDAALMNGAAWDSGHLAAGILLDGVDDYVDTAFPAAGGGVSAWTMEAWVYDTKGSGTLRHVIVVQPTAWYGLQINTANQLQVAPCPAGGATVTTGAWTHLAATYDGATVTYYVDGAPAGSVACSFPSSYWTGLRLGAASAADSGRARGTIDEIQIWRSSRSAAQIAADASGT